MFRASVLSILLTLAVGPNLALLCGTWCDPQAVAASECHHEAPATSPSVAVDDRCDNMVLGVAAFLRQDVRRGVASQDADQAVLVPRYTLAHSTIATRPRHEPGRASSLEKRPLSTLLRI